MWDWLRKLLGLKTHQCRVCGERFTSLEGLAGHFNEVHKSSTTLEEEKPEEDPFEALKRRWASNADIRTRKPPSLLELSNRRNPAPSIERKMPKSFRNRPGVKQAQVNLKKAGYDPKAKIEDDPPRRRRR